MDTKNRTGEALEVLLRNISAFTEDKVIFAMRAGRYCMLEDRFVSVVLFRVVSHGSWAG